LFGTWRDDDYDEADNLLLLLLILLSLNPVFMCMLTVQPSDQLLKQHNYKEINITQREEKRKLDEASSVKRQS
jgi:hypothetical protein